MSQEGRLPVGLGRVAPSEADHRLKSDHGALEERLFAEGAGVVGRERGERGLRLGDHPFQSNAQYPRDVEDDMPITGCDVAPSRDGADPLRSGHFGGHQGVDPVVQGLPAPGGHDLFQDEGAHFRRHLESVGGPPGELVDFLGHEIHQVFGE
jgi:hypothetical protein